MKVKEAYEISLKLWKWLSKNPTKGKEDWKHYDKLLSNLENECPFCELYFDTTLVYRYGRPQTIINCKSVCPLKIKDQEDCADGVFNIWANSTDMKLVQRMAKVIYDMIKESYDRKYKKEKK